MAMGFFGMLFWIAVLWFAIRALRCSNRRVAVGPRGYWPGWYRANQDEARDPARTGRDNRDDYIDSLETRVTELEERLDFTERLLAGR
jgi:hypothetical protein